MPAGRVSLRDNAVSGGRNIAAVFCCDFRYITARWPVEFVRAGVENVARLICGL